MKKTIKFFLVAIAATAMMFSACKKEEENNEEPEIINVSAPIINSENTYFYCADSQIISWSEPEVIGNYESNFSYQFIISEDDGKTWKSFERQNINSVTINRDVKFNHASLSSSENIPLNYLDSLNADILYQYKIRAYYNDGKSGEKYVESDIAKFYVKIINKKVYFLQFKDNKLEVTWDFPKNYLDNILIFCGSEVYNDEYYYMMASGSIEIDNYLLDNYYIFTGFDKYADIVNKNSYVFSCPKLGYDLNVFSISFYLSNGDIICFTDNINWNEE